MSDADLAQARVRQLTARTRTLTQRLSSEMTAFQEGRPQDVAHGLTATQEMANLYRRDTAHVKANPTLLAAAPTEDRRDLMEATEIFDGVLARHALAVEAARTISEGLVRTIAQDGGFKVVQAVNDMIDGALRPVATPAAPAPSASTASA